VNLFIRSVQTPCRLGDALMQPMPQPKAAGCSGSSGASGPGFAAGFLPRRLARSRHRCCSSGITSATKSSSPPGKCEEGGTKQETFDAVAAKPAKVQSLSLAVRQWRDLTLPLPFVLLPLNFARSIWTFCALYHEIGHNLDQDLKILQGLRSRIPETVPAEQEPDWRRWSAEILADDLGIVLGGAGFGIYLASEALLLGPAQRYRDQDPDAVHPPFLVRVPLITAMLRATNLAEFTVLPTCETASNRDPAGFRSIPLIKQ
jgi:hypothetical protein